MQDEDPEQPVMKPPVTLRTIADESGFHLSTVSLALRGDERIKSSTRDVIERVARDMGYRPDPILRALCCYRKSVHPVKYHATIAWLTSGKEMAASKAGYIFKKYYVGANARGEQLGYKLEEFSLRTPGMTADRLEDILQARGVSGILVPPLGERFGAGRIALNWAKFHAVTFGHSMVWPPIHRVSTNHSGGVKLALRKLYSLGYRRIGISIDRVTNIRVGGNWLGGYMDYAINRGMEPFVFLRKGSGSYADLLTKCEEPNLRKWVLKMKLDAIIFDFSVPFVKWLRESCKLRVPEDIGVASLNVQSEDEIHSGIDQREYEMGWHALDTVANMVNSGERGIPEVPHKLLIEGSWRQGETVRRLAVK